MARKRSLPWIYRWSRPIIGAIAIAGAILTAYLTVTILMGGDVACPADGSGGAGCSGVFNSRYAKVFDLPLSLFGCLAYISMAVFALSPLLVSNDASKTFRKQIENWTWLLLLAGSTSMAVFSGYLMYLLAFEIKTVCVYCIGSAIFALSMFILTIMGRDWEDIGQIFFTGAIVAVITLVGALGVYADSPTGLIPIPQAEGSANPPKGWEVTTESGDSEIALAEHLTEVGAKKYGAFWCPHCYEQKQLFGKKAFEQIDYVECANFENPSQQSPACAAAGITGYPTWEINGEKYSGTQLLPKLAELSGYEGKQEFKYRLP